MPGSSSKGCPKLRSQRLNKNIHLDFMIPEKLSHSYRILHTADWHLGKLLDDQSRDEEHARFLDWLLSSVKQYGVDAIVLAGDVFDSANPPQSAQARYYNFVSGLFHQGGCALVVISGNHDSGALLEAPRQALHALNTHVAGYLAEDPANRILMLPDAVSPRVAIALLPFLRDRDLRVGKAGEAAEEIRTQIVAGIRARYQESADAAVSLHCPLIATGHLTVVGASTSESEREIHIGGLGAVNSEAFPAAFSYVALGHLHRPQATDPAGRVRYAGSPIPLSFSEAADCKEVRILDVTQEGITQHSLAVPVFRKLVQVRCTRAGLEDVLAHCNPSPGDLRTWLEVVVEDAALEVDLIDQVRKLAEGRNFDILKVLRGRTEAIRGMTVGDTSDDEAISTILDNPTHVFEHLLGERTELTEEESATLKTTFAVLVDLNSQSETSAAP